MPTDVSREGHTAARPMQSRILGPANRGSPAVDPSPVRRLGATSGLHFARQ